MSHYLSVVLGIGGDLTADLIDRLQLSLRNNLLYAQQFEIDLEVVIVEWNTPVKRLDCAIERPLTNHPIRIIHTGNLHDGVPNPHGFRFREMQAKNIGIRRAKGRFILSTNPDDLWSEDLAAYFGRQELRQGHFYRVNRHDTRAGEVFRICYATGAKSPQDTAAQIKLPSSPRAAAWHENMLHYSAAGDFTLMSRPDWFMIHGNPERDWNDSVDGETVWLAHQKGIRQVILPYPIFHPDHPRTLNFSHNTNRTFSPGWDDNNPRATMNGDAWGFKDIEFQETLL